jgi:hypothetical protein
MTDETKDASQVLHEGQPVHITTDDESIDYQGTILELSGRFLAVSLDIDAKHFWMPLQSAASSNVQLPAMAVYSASRPASAAARHYRQ